MNSLQHTPGSVGLARLFWMLIGPMILTLLALSIASRGESWFTAFDLIFLACLCLLPLARWYEFQAGNPRTSTGEAASGRDLRGYRMFALFIGLAVWVSANVLGIYVLAH